MNNIVNLAIQVLPLEKSRQEAYTIIDKAIATVNASGLKYVVSPFETVIEGPYDKVMQLLNDIQTACYEGGADSLLINMKLHTSKVTDMAINDKIGKYKDQ